LPAAGGIEAAGAGVVAVSPGLTLGAAGPSGLLSQPIMIAPTKTIRRREKIFNGQTLKM